MLRVNERIEDVYQSAIKEMESVLSDVCEDICTDAEIGQAAREWHRLRGFYEVSQTWRGVVGRKRDNEYDAILKARGL